LDNEKNQSVLAIIKNVLKNPKTEHIGQIQFEFNCPSVKCKNDDNKFNLGLNVEVGIFHCWKCKYKGVIHKVVEDYGKQDDIERLNIVFPKENVASIDTIHIYDANKDYDNITCELPDGFKSLSKEYNSKYYTYAMNYLKKRNVSMDIIKKHNIGYTEDGSRKFRIIIPSYNSKNKLNYYEARSYMPFIKPNYYKPDQPKKSDIIFNEKNINFNLPVYLVEGVFDMFPLYNAIPLLGKDISDLLLHKLIVHKTKIIICLDEDAFLDVIELYNKLSSYDLDVYFVRVKYDIAEYYQKFGKDGLVQMIRQYKKLDFEEMINVVFENKKQNKRMNDDFIKKDWQQMINPVNFN